MIGRQIGNREEETQRGKRHKEQKKKRIRGDGESETKKKDN